MADCTCLPRTKRFLLEARENTGPHHHHLCPLYRGGPGYGSPDVHTTFEDVQRGLGAIEPIVDAMANILTAARELDDCTHPSFARTELGTGHQWCGGCGALRDAKSDQWDSSHLEALRRARRGHA